MPGPEDAEADLATNIIPPILATAPDDVREVEALPGYRLRVTFCDSTSGVVDMAEMIASSTTGVFAALRDPDLFNAVRVQLGAVTWPGRLDLAPDAMYAALLRNGKWYLR